MNFEAYSGKNIQNFMSMLNQCEIDGVYDIRFVRQRLQDHLSSRFVMSRVRKVRHNAVSKPLSAEICPSCGKQTLFPAPEREGLKRVGCKCGYSQVVK